MMMMMVMIMKMMIIFMIIVMVRRERGKGFDNAKCFFMNGTAAWYFDHNYHDVMIIMYLPP